MPMSQLLIDAEDGHKLAILAAKKNLLFSPKFHQMKMNYL